MKHEKRYEKCKWYLWRIKRLKTLVACTPSLCNSCTAPKKNAGNVGASCHESFYANFPKKAGLLRQLCFGFMGHSSWKNGPLLNCLRIENFAE
jgi:hypothetical protein